MEIPSSFFHVSFNKAMAFGYRTDDVDVFVTQAIQYIHDLQDENDTLMEKMGVLADNLSKYREEEDSLRSALVGAQKLGDSILRDCRSKAEAILRDATARADKVTQDAADELARTQYELETLRSETTEFKEKLFTLYRTHLAHINNIPSNKEIAEHHRKTPPPPPAPVAPAAPEPDPAPEPEPTPPPPAPEEDYPSDYTQHDYDDKTYEEPKYDDEPPAEPAKAKAIEYYDEYHQEHPTEEPAAPPQPAPDQDYYDFPDKPASEEDFNGETVVEYSDVNYEEEPPVLRENQPAEVAVVQAVTVPDDEEHLTTYQPRTRSDNRRGKGVFEPLSMVQMEFFESDKEDDDEPDGFFTDTENLRSVDLNKIPYFDDEDEEDDDTGAPSAGGKHRISKKFGELKFGDSFSLTDD